MNFIVTIKSNVQNYFSYEKIYPDPCAALIACNDAERNPTAETIASINSKRKPCLVRTGMANFWCREFCWCSTDPGVKKEFNQAVAILHSFEYDEAEKAFAEVIAKDPACAMAYWGVAMSNFHPLWEPPTENELKKGDRAINIAQNYK
jgi:TolA-binding protein